MNKLAPVFAVAALMLSACGNRAAKAAEEGAAVNVADSITMIEGLGELVRDFYEGVLPGADVPGINYALTLYRQALSDSGVYELKMTYLEAENGQDMTITEYGTWNTAYSAPYNIIGLASYDGGFTSFYNKGGSLEMLSLDMQPIDSQLNFTLVKK